MSKPKISVIIPIYNTKDYIEETLLSILNQSIFNDLEVIMVDDESTDDSEYIIEKYALKYENFHAYHKKNEGQGIARNYGLHLARGEYVIFLDSDDYVPPEAYETLYSLALKNNSDIAVGNVLRFALYNVWEDNLFKNSFKGITEIIDSTTLDEMPSLLWDTVTWNKLYRREFLLENNIEFPNKKISFQDIPFSLEAYILADSISITPEVCYYWRLRSDNTSVTQQDKNVSNFRNRLEITQLSYDIMERYEVSDDLKKHLFVKWMHHDLKFNLKRINEFPSEYHDELLEKVYEISSLIPKDLIDSQNSYKKALFNMILNREFDDVLKFAPLENELYENPEVPSFIDEKYLGYFDFNRDIENEELFVELSDVEHDENNLIIEFDETLYYLSSDIDYDISAFLIDGDGKESSVDIDAGDKKHVIIPFSEFKDKNHLKLKLIYRFDAFKKEAFMKNRHRKSISFDGFDVDLNLGVDSHLYLDFKQKNENEIEITDVSFTSNEFILEANSKSRIDEVFIENIISFDRISCSVEYLDDARLKFTVPYDDILGEVVKKWEINCSSCPNSIRLSKNLEFFTKDYKIRFLNTRNKILIENEFFDIIETVHGFNSEIKVLKAEINKLKWEKGKLIEDKQILQDKNQKLKDEINSFKSRKVVKFADKLNKIK